MRSAGDNLFETSWPVEHQAGRVITYCGGSISASNDAFVLTLLGHGDVPVYDVSLSEWAADPLLPMQAG